MSLTGYCPMCSPLAKVNREGCARCSATPDERASLAHVHTSQIVGYMKRGMVDGKPYRKRAWYINPNDLYANNWFSELKMTVALWLFRHFSWEEGPTLYGSTQIPDGVPFQLSGAHCGNCVNRGREGLPVYETIEAMVEAHSALALQVGSLS